MSHDNHRIDIDFELAPPDRLEAHYRRQLSAMLDGELSPDQARFMLRRLQHDRELAARWERWQVCGDVLRGRGHALLPADFSSRVAAAIAAPQTAGTAQAAASAGSARPHRLLRWGGGALAASVALVALLMVIFPISKLLHAPGVFFSPTRNQVDNPREHRHVAAWAARLDQNN